MMILYNSKKECCGCFACYSICPQKAIDMNGDNEGFLYPCIDISKCIECRLCITVCPIKKQIKSVRKGWEDEI